MAREDQDDAFYAGNRRTLRYSIDDQDNPGQKLNLSGLTFKWALVNKRSDGTYDLTPILQKTSAAGGIAVTNAATGALEVYLLDADSASLAGDYYYQLEATDGDGNKMMLATGTLTIKRNIIET